MRKECKMICWGIVIVSFHFNLGAIQILPGFVGWILFAVGINELFQLRDTYYAKRVKRASITFAVLTTLLTIIEYCGGNLQEAFFKIIAVVPIFEVLVCYNLIHAMGEWDQEGQNDYQTYLTVYLIFSTIYILTYASYYVFYEASIIVIAALMAIVIRISLLVAVRRFGMNIGEQEME